MYKTMLVDPDINSREKIKKMLDWKKCGFTLDDYTESASSTLDLLRKHEYKLIIINMKQLKLEGLKVSELIREVSRIPILLIGGSNNFDHIRKAITLQVSDYLPDPVDTNEFMISLSTIKKKYEDSMDVRKSKVAKRSISNKKSGNTILENVKEYVEKEISENITLKKISTTFNYNCSYLGQKFKQHENMTFNEYVLQQRMEKAKYLLDNTDLKIYEIANQVGYIELDWFYKKFKSYTGVSATEYRRISIASEG